MKYNRLSFLSVLTIMGMFPMFGNAAIRVGNAARNNAQGYQQVNTQRYQAENAAQMQQIQSQQQPAELPINVANQQLAQQIQSGDANAGVGIEDLERCSMIYPNGQFEWAHPTIGMQAGGPATCTAVVELRALIPSDGQEYTVLARANLAAGDSFECNAFNFPQAALMDALETIEVPADAEPSKDDVIAVMNEEQKQNAALKIISGAVLGGLGGNAAGKNEVGKDGILGGGKDKITGTLIGAVGGAGLMAASTYSGKVAGDMILSTGVNAAAGAVIGNMVTSGDSVLRIDDCTDLNGGETKCLYGYLEKEDSSYNSQTNKTFFVNVHNTSQYMACESDTNNTYKNCEQKIISGGYVDGYQNAQSDNKGISATPVYLTISEVINKYKSDGLPDAEHYCYSNGKMEFSDKFAECIDTTTQNNQYVLVKNVTVIESRLPAMIVGVEDSAFGYKKKDWGELKSKLKSKQIVKRGANGKAEEFTTADNITPDLARFDPMYVSTESGGVIDLDNKARMKGTLTGAGIGGAAGAFTAYQGTQSEIDERWVTAVRAYKDSLQKFYCGTGQRFLSFYNDMTVIPNQN